MNRNHDHGSRCVCGFLPPYIEARLALSDDPVVRRIGHDTSRAGSVARTMRLLKQHGMQGRNPKPGTSRNRTVYDMESLDAPLPGVERRSEKQPATGIEDVDAVFDHAGITHDFYKKVFKRQSLNGAGYPLKGSVNYGFQVVGAYWTGDQVLYGAGDGEYFLSAARSLEIAAHELTHGLIGFTSMLQYQNEPGALNESFCDVIGISVAHHHAKTPAENANWFVGGDLVGAGLGDVRGFRTFLAEKAFMDNHPVLGSDPQPKHMRDYVHDPEDNGGVHTNSGIPNHAFYLAAMAIGGNVWDCATLIWYEAFTKALNPQATFAQAAQATEAVARRDFGDREGDAVAQAWLAVGVESRD